MFRKIIENTTRKENGVFWNRFAGMVRGLADVPQEAAGGLDEVTIFPEGGMQVAPSSTDTSFIRDLYLRLWSVTIAPALGVVRLKKAKETVGMYAQIMATHALAGVRYLTKLFPEDNYPALIVACAAFFSTICLNAVVICQMMMLRQFLQTLDARLENIDLNQATLITQSCEKVSNILLSS
jgi:hypothetical protein